MAHVEERAANRCQRCGSAPLHPFGDAPVQKERGVTAEAQERRNLGSELKLGPSLSFRDVPSAGSDCDRAESTWPVCDMLVGRSASFLLILDFHDVFVGCKVVVKPSSLHRPYQDCLFRTPCCFIMFQHNSKWHLQAAILWGFALAVQLPT